MGCAGEGNESRPPSRAELIPTPHAKQQIPRTLSPRKRGCKQLGMTSPTILDKSDSERLSICNVALINMQRPTGVTAIAVVFLLIAACLGGIGVVMLVSPEAVSMTRGAPLLHGLELGGPYAALLVGAAWALIGWGLLRLYDWARLAAMLVIISGVGVLVARFALNASRFRSSLVWEGLEVFMRVAVVWYLFRTPVAEQFSKSARAT